MMWTPWLQKHLKVIKTKIVPCGCLFICVKFQGQILIKISMFWSFYYDYSDAYKLYKSK
jgi:hypothetical protein